MIITKAAMALALAAAFSLFAIGQAPQTAAATETPVSLTEPSTAVDAQGQAALAGRLRTTDLRGTQDLPINNTRIVISNAGRNLYTYVSGWATFYDSEGVRCGEGLFKLNALAAGESAETDTPGLRLVCTPTTWRILATNLLTVSGDTAKPAEAAAVNASTQTQTEPLTLSIDGEDHPIQFGNPITIRSGGKTLKLVLKRGQ